MTGSSVAGAGCVQCGTVHLGAGELELVRWSADIESLRLPDHPFLLSGQMTTADATRSPAGTGSAWAHTHLPRGITDDESADELARRVDRVLELFAPGSGDRVLHRHVQRPSDLQSSDPNLGQGTVNGGTAQLFQQLVFAPSPDSGDPRTRSRICTAPARPRIPGAGCTGSAARSPLNPPCAITGCWESRADA
jgi:phytoene dehydrogenase-like protein